jgi:hypothetical protein
MSTTSPSRQWRPGRDAGRAGRYPPDLPGPHRHGALQRRDDGRAAGRQAAGLQRDGHRRSGAPDGGGGPRNLAAGTAGGGARRHHARPVRAGRRHGAPARGLGPDGHRAGDDRGAGRARHPLGDAGGLRDPDLVPSVLHPAGRHGHPDLQHRDVRPDPRRGDAGRRRHRRRRIRRQAPEPGRAADAGLYRRRQADVLARRLVHRDDALRLPADAVLARRGGRVHGHAARDADLRPLGLADRGADLPAGPGRGRGALVAYRRPGVHRSQGPCCPGMPRASCWRRAWPS